MNPFRADLHCHTTCSDGTLSPTDTVRLAKQIGLSGLSITDHDTVEAYATVIPLCDELGIELLVGAEFSTVLKNISVHILGYGFQCDDANILALCARHSERRRNRNLAILGLLKNYGMTITEADLEAACTSTTEETFRHTIGRPHIALALLKKGYVTSIQDAFKKFLNEGMVCYVQGAAFSIDETLDVIHKAKGLAVIAHPHLIIDPNIMRRLIEMDFDGMECYYGKFPPQNHERWLKIAKKKEWLITGGSDFHGAIKPNIPLGCSWVSDEHFLMIKNRLRSL